MAKPCRWALMGDMAKPCGWALMRGMAEPRGLPLNVVTVAEPEYLDHYIWAIPRFVHKLKNLGFKQLWAWPLLNRISEGILEECFTLSLSVPWCCIWGDLSIVPSTYSRAFAEGIYHSEKMEVRLHWWKYGFSGTWIIRDRYWSFQSFPILFVVVRFLSLTARIHF